jgi:hypothetical protein
MQTIIVASVHNNRLGPCINVDSFDDGKEQVKQLSKEKLVRDLTLEEIEEIDNNGEFYCDEDSNNVWSYSVGIVE